MTKRRYEKLEKLLADPEEVSLDWSEPDKKSFEAVTWDVIEAMQFPDDRWLIKDILPKEGLSILASISGEGKSLIVMHLAKCLSEGSALFGYEGFQAKKSNVLYVNLEMSDSEVQRRGRLIGFDNLGPELLILSADNFNLNNGEGSSSDYIQLVECIVENQIDVVIIDTFRASSGGLKEDKAEEVRQFFRKFLPFKNSGVSVIFTEHLRKPNHVEGKIPKKEQLLGSQDKTANLEVLLMIRKDESTQETHFYQRKNRLGPEHKPFAVKISDITDAEGKKRLSFEYVGEIDDDVNKKEQAKDLILDLLTTEAKTTKQILEILKVQQVGQKNTRQALRELTIQGLVTKTKVGRQDSFSLPTENTLESYPFDENDLFLDQK